MIVIILARGVEWASALTSDHRRVGIALHDLRANLASEFVLDTSHDACYRMRYIVALSLDVSTDTRCSRGLRVNETMELWG